MVDVLCLLHLMSITIYKTAEVTVGKSKATNIRTATQDDVGDLVRIDAASYATPWTNRRFRTVLENHKDIVILVAGNSKENVSAYMVYDLMEKSIGIRRMAAYPEFAALLPALVIKLKNLLQADKRNGIVMYVPETHMSTLVMLREQGFRADRNAVMHNFFPESGEDAFILQYRLGFLTTDGSATNVSNATRENLCKPEDAPRVDDQQPTSGI